MKYTVQFLRDAIVTELITARVKADSEEEIESQLKKGNYEPIGYSDTDYSGDNDTITDIKII